MNRCWNNGRTVPPCVRDIVGGDCWEIVPHRPNSSPGQGRCWGIVHALARWAWKGPGSCAGGPRRRFSSFLIVCPGLRPARLQAPPLVLSKIVFSTRLEHVFSAESISGQWGASTWSFPRTRTASHQTLTASQEFCLRASFFPFKLRPQCFASLLTHALNYSV